MHSALSALRRGYDQRYETARRHKAAGRTVVGYFLNTVPREIILAAGFFPVCLAGCADRRPQLAAEYMEEYFDGEVQSIFGLLAEGCFDFVDLVVIPRSCEVYLQLYYLLLEFRKWRPDAPVPPLYLFDLLQSPYRESGRYVVGRCRDFAQRLAAMGGRPVTDEALSAAIRTVNASRRLLGAASTLWKGAVPALDGVDALKVIGAGSALDIDQHQALLEALVGNPPAPLPRSGPRLLLKGSPQSDGRFTTLVEQAGGAVVAHDHAWGDRNYQSVIDENADPWEALAEHYRSEVPSPRAYPQEREDRQFLALAQAAAVDGVIFYHDEWDDTLGWEYPDQKQLLDRHAIPSLYLKRQPYFDPPQDAQRAAVGSFLDSLGSRTRHAEGRS